LRHGHPSSKPGRGPSAETIAAMTVQQLWDSLGVRISGPDAARGTWVIDATIRTPSSSRGSTPQNIVRRDATGDAAEQNSPKEPLASTERWIVGMSNGALWTSREPASLEHHRGRIIRLSADHHGLGAFVFGARSLDELEADGSVTVTEGRDHLVSLIDHLDRFTLMFPIVTP